MPLPPEFDLYLITDRQLVPEGDLLTAVAKALQGGVKAVQLREKDLSARDLYILASKLRALTHEFGARLLINGRIDVALATGADGVHLGADALPVSAARELLGADRLIGVSTHHLSEIAAAENGGADFVTFGPVYHTPSKAPFGPPVGIPALAAACASTSLPVYALGGIKPQHLSEILRAGAAGAALISAVLSSPDPAAEASCIRQILQGK